MAGFLPGPQISPGAADSSQEDGMAETGDRIKVVVYYAVWATICAALAGIAVALLHTWFFSFHVGRSGFLQTLVSDIETTLAIAAGPGAGAVRSGSRPAPRARPPGEARQCRLPTLLVCPRLH